WVAADMLSSCQATVAALEAERDAARDALNHVFQQKDELLKDLNQTTIRAETAEADLKHLRSMAGKSRGELEAFLAEMQKRPPLCDDEGCPHHGTVHICSDIETQRLQRLMSSSEAERYRSCGELLTSLTACQREKEGLLEELIAARKFIKSVAPLITETAHYQYDIPTQKVIEDALNSEGA
ncbi:hypothetical protein ACQKHB_23195, partial [Escherichia coli]|uniref:hypothetical protein n=1 Tax=Escherichia coli TaxID=562 RepID=UPI003D091D8A